MFTFIGYIPLIIHLQVNTIYKKIIIYINNECDMQINAWNQLTSHGCLQEKLQARD